MEFMFFFFLTICMIFEEGKRREKGQDVLFYLYLYLYCIVSDWIELRDEDGCVCVCVFRFEPIDR